MGQKSVIGNGQEFVTHSLGQLNARDGVLAGGRYVGLARPGWDLPQCQCAPLHFHRAVYRSADTPQWEAERARQCSTSSIPADQGQLSIR